MSSTRHVSNLQGGLTTSTAHYTSSQAHNRTSLRVLQSEYTELQKKPVEGFTVKLGDDNNLYKWHVGIFGPPGTLYEGGYFKALMEFPLNYPFEPPTVRFLTKMWHPNIYDGGVVCISILHPPTDDPQSGEDPSERWNPTQNVRTILMSIISLLNEPNCSSPANVDAAVMYRKYKEQNDKEYENIIRQQVNDSKLVAAQEGIVIPETLDEYLAPSRVRASDSKKPYLSLYSHEDDDLGIDNDDDGHMVDDDNDEYDNEYD